MNITEYFDHLISSIPDMSWEIEPCETADLHQLYTWSLSSGIILVLLILVLLYFVQKNHRFFNQFTDRWLPSCFAVVWLIGFVVYDVGTYTGEWPSLFLNMPMAILHSLGMFLFESDVSAIHAPFHDNWTYMGLFSVTHFLAAIISFAFVIRHFGFALAAWFRMFFMTRVKQEGNLYVLWGMNDATYYLADSIKKFYQDRKDYRIVVVRTHNDHETDNSHNGMARLFSFLSLKNREFSRLQELRCYTTSAFSSVATISGSVARLIRNTNGDVHLFFLSGDADNNIRLVGEIRHDNTLNSILGAETKTSAPLMTQGVRSVALYCRARYNSVHRVIENDFLKDHLFVNVVDTAHISIEMLKQNVDLQPVSYVKIENDATVSTPFHSLVVGFDEVGYDAVRFLYEFGAFVKTGSTADHVEQSDFHCDVVDKNMSELAGVFVANAPSVSVSLSVDDKKTDRNSLVSLHQMDPKGVRFYQYLKEWIKTLNYIVVAQADDEANISLAVRIFQFAVRYRKDMENFRILVRVQHDADGHIHRIAEHYNRLWKAEMQSEEKKRLHQKYVSATEKVLQPITIFGEENSMFTYDYILSDTLKNLAKQFKAQYNKSVSVMKNTKEQDKDWDEEYRDLMHLAEAYKGYSPTLSGIQRLRRIQRQDLENSLHMDTKIKLAKCALGEEQYGVFSRHELSRKNETIVYNWKEYVQPKPAVTRVLDVLAQTEHLRWNASHEILGYRQFGEEGFQDEARMQHACIVPWEKLSERIKSYDYNVVDVSLGLIDTSVP